MAGFKHLFASNELSTESLQFMQYCYFQSYLDQSQRPRGLFISAMVFLLLNLALIGQAQAQEFQSTSIPELGAELNPEASYEVNYEARSAAKIDSQFTSKYSISSAASLSPERQSKATQSTDYQSLPGFNPYLISQDETQTVFDTSKDWLADYLNSVSGDLDSFFIDSFFSDDILLDDQKGSKAKLSFNTRRKIGQPVDYNFSVSVKLELPKVHKKLNLIFESNEEDEAINNNDVAAAAENVEYSAALRFIVREKNNWRINLDTGIRWKIPPEPFSRLRIRRFSHMPWDINLRSTQEFSWYSSKGWGTNTSFRFDKKVSDKKLLRLNNSAKYLLNDDYFTFSSSLTLYHELNTKEALAYILRASGDDQEHATYHNYGIGIRFRRQVYSDWMYAEIAPELESSREDNYDIVPVIMFRFEALISK